MLEPLGGHYGKGHRSEEVVAMVRRNAECREIIEFGLSNSQTNPEPFVSQSD